MTMRARSQAPPFRGGRAGASGWGLTRETVKNRPQVVRQNLEAHEGDICTSSITAMELLYGAHKSQAVRRNLDVITCRSAARTEERRL
jgi:hypothetical protein